MKTENIINFFNHQSDNWDEQNIVEPKIISKIFNGAKICENSAVLDVACGTGILIPEYLKKGVKSVTAVDIAPKMVEKAKEKFGKEENVKIICCDVESYNFNEKFDRIVVYNAFPHFPNPERLIERLCSLLNVGGILTVAHGTSKENIDKIHTDSAADVSIELLSSDRLAEIFSKYLEVTVNISNDKMYQVSGKVK